MAVYMYSLVLFTNCFLGIFASYHWIVTEHGKIRPQVGNSGFPLTKNDDLLVFLEQEQRLSTISELYKQLLKLKKSIDLQWAKIEGEGDLEKRLYSTDIDCLLGGVPLSQHNLNTEFLDYGQGSRPKMKNGFQSTEPDCTKYSSLDFSMRTFPHLDTLNKRGNFNLTVKPVPSKTVFDVNIDAMLRVNNSDWTAYNLASSYWRAMGNGTHAVECARRALYFSPIGERYLVLLNLGTLLQELNSLGEAAIVLHSAVDHNPVHYLSHLALGNIYASLGDYKRSIACYDNVLSLSPGNVRALQLKHALLCQKKLESGLLEIHSSLQSILQDLQKHNSMHEEWLFLQNQVSWERDSKMKEFLSFSQPLYLNLKMLLQNVEQQAKTLNDEVSKKVPKKKSIKSLPLIEEGKNEINSQQDLDCTTDHCPDYDDDDDDEGNIDNSPSSITHFNELESEESELENFISPETLLKNNMDSLISLIKSKYEQEVKVIDFNRNKLTDQFRGNTKMELRGMTDDTHFPVHKSFLLDNLDVCVKESSNVKKLN